MKRIKLDRYVIYEKGREYEILVFPFVKYMWVFDGGPAEDGLYISGSGYSYTMLRYAFALLTSDPGKLVFFPCRQPGVEGMFEPNYHLVLYRPELQFRRSLWVKIKKKADRKHWKSRYVLCYDGKKTDDYYKNVLRKKYGCPNDPLPNRAFNTQPWGMLEEIVGETFFVQINRNRCYELHYYTGQDIKTKCQEGIPFRYTYLGQIWSEKSVRKWDTLADKKTEPEKKESGLAEKEDPPDVRPGIHE